MSDSTYPASAAAFPERMKRGGFYHFLWKEWVKAGLPLERKLSAELTDEVASDARLRLF